MTDVLHQLIAAEMMLIGAVKALFGYFVVRSASDHGDVRAAVRYPPRTSFRLLLGLTKLTSDAPLYVILGVLTASSPNPVALWAAVWVNYCFVIQLATFLKWADEQWADGQGEDY